MWVTPKTKQRPGKARQAWGCILSLKVFAWVGPLLTTLISVLIFPVVQGRLAKLDCFLPKLIPNVWSFYLPFHCLQGASPDCKMMGTPANVHSQLKCYLLLGAFCDYTIYIVSPLLALSWSHRSVWSSLFTTWNCLAHWLVLSSSLLLGSKLHGHRDRVCPLHYSPGALRWPPKQVLTAGKSEHRIIIRKKPRVLGDFRGGEWLIEEQNCFMKI